MVCITQAGAANYAGKIRAEMGGGATFEDAVDSLYEGEGWGVTLSVIFSGSTLPLEPLWDELCEIATNMLRDLL